VGSTSSTCATEGESVTPTEPERELVRRVLPFIPPAIALAFAAGALTSGVSAGWSAAIGGVVVAANFLANALSMARAARISAIAVYAVGLGGFVVRMGAIFAVMFALNRLDWFSPLAFALTVVPSTMALLVYEMRLLSGRRVQADLWYFREAAP
jgi:predicted sugar kinase